MSAVSEAPAALDAQVKDGAGNSEDLAVRARAGWKFRPSPYWAAFGALLLVALLMRLWDLGAMALHHDESLHATYGWYLFSGRGYRHDPMMHGPFQFFANAGAFTLLGDSSYTARVAAALSGTALVAAPLLFIRHLGKAGALVTSVLLAFSPVMLYYSRFSRSDIHIALWTVLLIGLIWQYLDTRKARYLALASAALLLAFSVKETAYLLAAILGSFFFLAAIMDVVPWVMGRKSLRDFSPAGDVLVVLVTLVMPLGAAIVSLAQGPLGVTLANPEWTKGPIGIPMGPGRYVAVLAGVGMIAGSLVIGLRWRPRVWLLCAAIFWSLWALLFTSFFTNLWQGLGTGIWQSLGYWIAQQGVARGGQPWYYYFVIGLNYEFLPLLVGTVAAAVFAVRGSRFGKFLAFWAVFNFLALTYASEKMPWLLMHVTIPFIFLSGKLLGSALERRPWGRAVASPQAIETTQKRGRLHWPAVGFTLLLAAFMAASGWGVLTALSKERDVVLLVFQGTVGLAVAIGLAYAFARVAKGKRLALAGASLALALFAMTAPSAFRAAYANADVPVEMLVYTQTAPDIPQIMERIDRLAEATGKGKDLRVLVDSTDGYSWPWAWYLRDYKQATHLCLSSDPNCSRVSSPPDADVVLLSERSNSGVAQYMEAYGTPVRYKHRWWFPESYRGMTPGGMWKAVRSREAMCNVAAYFVFREFGQPIGSVDAYAYFPKDFEVGKIGKDIAPKRMGC
ncbi:MAG: TIGR03663 family protein [Chloroflexi bacterium]|nr:TIGR03663 family protein [Chloroflexota bacterium]